MRGWGRGEYGHQMYKIIKGEREVRQKLRTELHKKTFI